jgi:hypothetical protein
MSLRSVLFVLYLLVSVHTASAAEPAGIPRADIQAQREAALSKMLSGATLEGSFTASGRDHKQDADKLTGDKYTLGEVKRVDGNNWVFPTRIQYSDKDFTLPLTLPIEWAGDTPVVVVDNVGIPGMGTFSARVLFYNDHYAGYWQHGEVGGNLFGRIQRAKAAATESN